MDYLKGFFIRSVPVWERNTHSTAESLQQQIKLRQPLWSSSAQLKASEHFTLHSILQNKQKNPKP